jgi:flagellar capping protein FliD
LGTAIENAHNSNSAQQAILHGDAIPEELKNILQNIILKNRIV